MTDINSYRARIGSFYFNLLKFKPLKANIFYSKKSKSSYISIFLLFILLSAQANNNFSLTTKLKSNKISHITNGNISAKGSMKFMHWNKGNSNFLTKLTI